MAQFPTYDPSSKEAVSSPIGAMSGAVAKLSNVLQMGVSTITDHTMTELYIDAADRFRIYHVPVEYRGWQASPSPVIKKNGVAITPETDYFEVNLLGGSIEFISESNRPTESDIITVTASYVNGDSLKVNELSSKIATVESKVMHYRGSFDTLEDLELNVADPSKYDYAYVFGDVMDMYMYGTSWVSVTANDVSALQAKIDEVSASLAVVSGEVEILGAAVADNTQKVQAVETEIESVGADVTEVLTRIGSPNPTDPSTANVFGYMKLLEDSGGGGGGIVGGLNKAVFLKSGLWVVPEGITKVWVTACAGGGAGATYLSNTLFNGSAGGATIVSNMFTLPGGSGGTILLSSPGSGGNGGSPGGGRGGSSSSTKGNDGIFGTGGNGSEGYFGGGGGSLGYGGVNPSYNNTKHYTFHGTLLPLTLAPNVRSGISQCYPIFGGGGSGFSNSTTYTAGGGGGGAAIVKKEYATVPGNQHTVTVGVGGNNSGIGESDTYSARGASGIVIFEW